jgi:hypothetical protein
MSRIEGPPADAPATGMAVQARIVPDADGHVVVFAPA